MKSLSDHEVIKQLSPLKAIGQHFHMSLVLPLLLVLQATSQHKSSSGSHITSFISDPCLVYLWKENPADIPF